jgi:hypothetical protein
MKHIKHLGILLMASIPSVAWAQSSTELGDVEDFGQLVTKIWGWGFAIILPLSIGMIIVGGFFYMASQGNDEKIDQAKQIINGSFISTGILLFSAVIQKFLSQPTAQLNTNGPVTVSQLPEAIKNTVNILLSFVGGFAIIMIIYSGYQYVSSRGDYDKLNHAKKGLTYALIGLAIAVGSYLLMNTFVGIFHK